MRRVAALPVAVLLLVGCDSTPTSPTDDGRDRRPPDPVDAGDNDGVRVESCTVTLLNTYTGSGSQHYEDFYYPHFDLLFRCGTDGTVGANVYVSARLWASTGDTATRRLQRVVNQGQENWICAGTLEPVSGGSCGFRLQIPKGETFRWKANWSSCAKTQYCPHPDYPENP